MPQCFVRPIQPRRHCARGYQALQATARIGLLLHPFLFDELGCRVGGEHGRPSGLGEGVGEGWWSSVVRTGFAHGMQGAAVGREPPLEAGAFDDDTSLEQINVRGLQIIGKRSTHRTYEGFIGHTADLPHPLVSRACRGGGMHRSCV